jgi:hypothetical protein
MPRKSARIVTLPTLALSLSFLLASPPLFAEQSVISDDGREILLKDDGSWEFRSTDRFANTPDGRRVRLKDDNTWEYIGQAKAPPAPPAPRAAVMHAIPTSIELDEVVVESYGDKMGQRRRTGSQTIFYIEVTVSNMAQKAVTLDAADPSRVRVEDSDGKRYDIVSVTPTHAVLNPGGRQTIAVRVDGSPEWWRQVQSMEVELPAGMVGNIDPIRISEKVRNFQKQTVDELQ